MKILNTPENKAKFFAYHLGCDVEYDFDGRPYKGTKKIDRLTLQNLELMVFSAHRKVLLRPLSSLTDNEAIEVAKIVLEEPFNRYKNIDVVRDYSVTGWTYISVGHKQLPHRLQIDCNLVNFNVIYMGDDVSNEFDMKPYWCIDYLRSIGIALPYHDLSVEDQISYNWIKKNNDMKTENTTKVDHLEWWNSLSDESCEAILKEEGIYGHDQGVNESEIESFYKIYKDNPLTT